MLKFKKMFVGVLASFVVLLIPATALAHVVVTPNKAGIGEELTFNVSVPNEQETTVTNVKLLIPQGVTNVVPTTLAGWTITTSASASSSTDITAITWSNGTIPVGQRTDFSFSAQVPANPTEVDWKAYQTYADGTIVHWDQKPAGSDDSNGNAGPYSVTQVINDLTNSPSNTPKSNQAGPYILSCFGILIAIVAFAVKRK